MDDIGFVDIVKNLHEAMRSMGAGSVIAAGEESGLLDGDGVTIAVHVGKFSDHYIGIDESDELARRCAEVAANHIADEAGWPDGDEHRGRWIAEAVEAAMNEVNGG